MAGFISGNATLSEGSVSTGALADNAVTLAKMAGGTDGNLIGIDASGDPAYIATGSDGDILTSGGAGVAAVMEEASGGIHTFLSTNSPSGAATTAFTTTADFSYDYVDFVFINMQGSATHAALLMEVSTNGGSSYRSSAYRYGIGRIRDDSSGSQESAVGSTSASRIQLTHTELDISPTTEPGFEGTIRLFDPSSSNQHQGYMHGLMTQASAGSLQYFSGGFIIDAAENIDAVRFKWSTGNLTGDVHMVGVNYA